MPTNRTFRRSNRSPENLSPTARHVEDAEIVFAVGLLSSARIAEIRHGQPSKLLFRRSIILDVGCGHWDETFPILSATFPSYYKRTVSANALAAMMR